MGIEPDPPVMPPLDSRFSVSPSGLSAVCGQLTSDTTTLFAAPNDATGKVIGQSHRRHHATEFKKFLVCINRKVPADLVLNLVIKPTAKANSS
jgi:hypothetical protein